MVVIKCLWGVIITYSFSGLHFTSTNEAKEYYKQPIYGKQKETHELIFSWLSWLAVLLVGAYARRRRWRRRRRWSRARWLPYSKITGWQGDKQPWFTVSFFGIGHPCYDQLTPVKTRYPLTSITWPYRGLKLTAHRGQVFFEGDRWPGASFSIGSRAHV